MKWGRRKPHDPSSPPSSSSSSSSRPTFMSHILPVSWLSKLKQKKSSQEEEPIPSKVKGREKRNSPSIHSPDHATRNCGQFNSRDDVDFWKLSFGEDDYNAKKSGGILTSVWYDPEDELDLPRSSCRSCRSKCTELGGEEEIHNLNEMVSRMARRRRRREAPREVKILRRECEIESRTPRSRFRENGNLKNLGRKVLEKKGLKPQRETNKSAKERAGKSGAKNILELGQYSRVGASERDRKKLTNSRKHQYDPIKSRNSNLGTIGEKCVFSSMKAEEESDGLDMVGNEIDSKWERMKDLKIEELKSRNERERKSLYLGRESDEKNPKCRRKVRVHSPRTATKIEICKIKALQDMKKAKLKMKKKVKERTAEAEDEAKTDLESFAVVKCSLDPQQDFRNSMVEMIMERRISKAEELEELLACYLTLNSDQYHDLIIKVFRQVWFDLNQASFNSELEN